MLCILFFVILLILILCVYLRLNLDGKTVKVDESCGISLVVYVVLAEGCYFLGVEGVVALCACLYDVALIELDFAGCSNASRSSAGSAPLI